VDIDHDDDEPKWVIEAIQVIFEFQWPNGVLHFVILFDQRQICFQRRIDAFIDLNPGEKKMFFLWDKFVAQNPIYSKRQLV
jgi:hypothetical protein